MLFSWFILRLVEKVTDVFVRSVWCFVYWEVWEFYPAYCFIVLIFFAIVISFTRSSKLPPRYSLIFITSHLICFKQQNLFMGLFVSLEPTTTYLRVYFVFVIEVAWEEECMQQQNYAENTSADFCMHQKHLYWFDSCCSAPQCRSAWHVKF